MNTNDIQLFRSLGATKRCPYCRAANLRWFGILRICPSCMKASHWRDVVSEA